MGYSREHKHHGLALWQEAVKGHPLTYSERVWAARAHSGLQQEDVASRVGFAQSAFSNIELGNRETKLHVVLAFALRVDPAWLEVGRGLPTLSHLNISEKEKTLLALYSDLSNAEKKTLYRFISPFKKIPPFDKKTIGERLKTRRKQLGYTQVALAEKIGVSSPCIVNLERQNIQCPLASISFADALSVPVDWFILGYGSMDGPRVKLTKDKIDFLLSYRTQSKRVKQSILDAVS